MLYELTIMTYQLLTTISENKVTGERERRSGERGREGGREGEGEREGEEQRERVTSRGGNITSL